MIRVSIIQALLTSIASGHKHGRTDVLTKNQITLGISSYVEHRARNEAKNA